MSISLHDLDLEDRALALVSVASKHDELHTVLTGSDRWMTDDRAEAALVAMARPLAHPLLDTGTLSELLRDLRDACSARSNYEVYGYLPDHLEDKMGDSYRREDVEDLLDGDVDLALFPLLTASSVACAECRRIKCDVTRWQPATIGLRCDAHRLVLAHDGVRLVAS